jgi:hypothetical protein
VNAIECKNATIPPRKRPFYSLEIGIGVGHSNDTTLSARPDEAENRKCNPEEKADSAIDRL